MTAQQTLIARLEWRSLPQLARGRAQTQRLRRMLRWARRGAPCFKYLTC